MVERNLAKVEVASSSLVSRSSFKGKSIVVAFLFCLRTFNRPAGGVPDPDGGVAKWLCSGLQSRVRRFDSGLRLQQIKDLRDQAGSFTPSS